MFHSLRAATVVGVLIVLSGQYCHSQFTFTATNLDGHSETASLDMAGTIFQEDTSGNPSIWSFNTSGVSMPRGGVGELSAVYDVYGLAVQLAISNVVRDATCLCDLGFDLEYSMEGIDGNGRLFMVVTVDILSDNGVLSMSSVVGTEETLSGELGFAELPTFERWSRNAFDIAGNPTVDDFAFFNPLNANGQANKYYGFTLKWVIFVLADQDGQCRLVLTPTIF
jgi:hypothetical protein